jgi:hypothetical protein
MKTALIIVGLWLGFNALAVGAWVLLVKWKDRENGRIEF